MQPSTVAVELKENIYKQLINNNSTDSSLFQASEKIQTYSVLKERHLQAMWLEQKYFKLLTLPNGTPITVLSPGIWNSEAGPDFLKAHIKIGDQELRGDIELHLQQDGWYHHNHNEDSRYDDVILHVCYWSPPNEKITVTSKKRPIPSIFLQSILTVPEARLLQLIDLDLYPYKLFVGSGRCARMLFSKISQENTVDLLRSAALCRLEEKWLRLQAMSETPPTALLAGICMTLGYKHNAEPFLSIFHLLYNSNISSESDLLSLALGSCGFFRLFFQQKWGESEVYLHLEKQYHHLKEKAATTDLRLDHIRPANHPVRRLALLAKLVADPQMRLLHKTVWNLWSSNWNNTARHQWKNLKDLLVGALPRYEDPYWERHYTFENKEQPKRITLLGDDLRLEILINVLLPFLYVHIKARGSNEEVQAFEDFYGSLPASKTKKTSYLGHRFFGETPKKLALLNADTQQGAYQIHRDFCVHYEASCQGCPFVERYIQNYKK